jgi:DNA-binding beta-propeller fold protein YncE
MSLRWAVRLLGAGLLAAALLLVSSPSRFRVLAAPEGAGYHIVHTYKVGGEGAWDYLTVDPEAHRVYISRSTHVMVLDEETGKVVGDIPNTKGVHGIALAKDLGRGFISDGGANAVTIFELASLKPVKTVNVTGQNPDAIIYDAANKHVFTMNGRTSNATVLDANSGEVVKTIPLAGKPETPVLDGKGHMFINIENKNSLQEVNTKTLAVEHTWPIAGCESPSGIAMDTRTDRVFMGCSDANKMAVVDTNTGKAVAMEPIGEDTDASAFDPETKLAFASCRGGTLSIIHEDSPNKFSVVGNVKTKYGARTMALDEKDHHVFTVTSDLIKQPKSPDNPEGRPKPVPGTFEVIELAP